jgi:hypothetical protein
VAGDDLRGMIGHPGGGGGLVNQPPDDDERVPLFGTWTRIYVAVLVNLLVVMAALLVFSRWPY